MRKHGMTKSYARQGTGIAFSGFAVVNNTGQAKASWTTSFAPGGSAVQVWRLDSSGAPVCQMHAQGVTNPGGTDSGQPYTSGQRWWAVLVDAAGDLLVRSNDVTTI